MNIHDFDTYRLEELADIYVNEINPESMTVPYSCEHIKDKRIKKYLFNDKNVFIVSTQKKKPNCHFKLGQTVRLQGPFFETEAKNLGMIEYIHKGFRMYGYFFQWK
ncbi:hypothetical protein WAY59_002351 [Escherichia coli]|nr:hypothetical protein [Escherichia coli]